jgi:hypothetical protein
LWDAIKAVLIGMVMGVKMIKKGAEGKESNADCEFDQSTLYAYMDISQ